MRLTVRLRSLPPDDDLMSCRDDVVGGARVRRGQILAHQVAGPAGPEEQTDSEADAEADRDVLDAHEPNLPADRLNEVEEDEEDDGEPGLARRERDRPRRVGRKQDRKRQHGPQHALVRTDREHERGADDDSHRRSRERAQDRPAGAERIRAQNGEGSEHHPERVLQPGPLRDEDRDRQARSAADAVLEPHRPADRMLHGELLGRVERGARRARGCCRSSDVEIVEPRRGRTARKQGVARDLPGGVGACADPEGRIERGEQLVVGRHARQLPDSPDERLRDFFARLFQAPQVGLRLAALQPGRAGPQHGDRCRHRLGVLVPAQLEGMVVRHEECQQPVELVGERG